MAQLNPQYPNRAALITAIDTRDYTAFTTDEIFDGVSREYIVVLPYGMVYAQRPDNRYRLISVANITNYGAD